jgi:penicillin-insensitive murein endopeptidase
MGGYLQNLLPLILFVVTVAGAPGDCDDVARQDGVVMRPTEAEAYQWALASLRESYRPCTPSHSVGLPWKGSLECGHLLPEHPRLQPDSFALFGTEETMQALVQAGEFLELADPGGPPMQVLDLSLPDGGKFPNAHVSHQSGRDVDVGYFVLGDTPGPYREVPLAQIDTLRTWILIRALISTGRVQRILMDHDIQSLVHDQAKRLGACGLNRLFQYPRRPKVKRGLIRHWPRHRNHIHIRFRCPRQDRTCRG